VQTTDWTSIDAYGGLRELVDAANETATSNPAASYARWDDDRPRDGYAVLPGASVHRDSDTLARSNAEVIRADIETRFPGALLIEGASHWAVGWVEAAYVPVRADDGSTHPAALAACDWAAALADYPVADESHFSELEYDEAVETIKLVTGGTITRDGLSYEASELLPDDWAEQTFSAMYEAGADTSPDGMRGESIEDAMLELGFYVPAYPLVLIDLDD
jgi:hypothetical protein